MWLCPGKLASHRHLSLYDVWGDRCIKRGPITIWGSEVGPIEDLRDGVGSNVSTRKNVFAAIAIGAFRDKLIELRS